MDPRPKVELTSAVVTEPSVIEGAPPKNVKAIVYIDLIFGIVPMPANKCTAVLASGQNNIPVLETPEEVDKLIQQSLANFQQGE